MTCFVDTSALLILLNRLDPDHKAGREQWEQLPAVEHDLVTPSTREPTLVPGSATCCHGPPALGERSYQGAPRGRTTTVSGSLGSVTGVAIIDHRSILPRGSTRHRAAPVGAGRYHSRPRATGCYLDSGEGVSPLPSVHVPVFALALFGGRRRSKDALPHFRPSLSWSSSTLAGSVPGLHGYSPNGALIRTRCGSTTTKRPRRSVPRWPTNRTTTPAVLSRSARGYRRRMTPPVAVPCA